MKWFETEVEVAADGSVVLDHLPFSPGDSVSVRVAPADQFAAMREYANRLGEASGEFAPESEAHITERLLRETEW